MRKLLLSMLVLMTIIISAGSVYCCSCSSDEDCSNTKNCSTEECPTADCQK